MNNISNNPNNAKHCGSTEACFGIPVRICFEPMKRLLIADFENDEEYESIEPQLFDDTLNGTGFRVLMYRKDKKVDVYHQKGVHINQETFSIGSGIGIVRETTFEKAFFDIDQQGVNLDVGFFDKNGERIVLKIKEKGGSKKHMGFLAPVGNDIKHPRQLFLAYMEEFDFVIKQNTEFEASVGNRLLKPMLFPLKRNGLKVYFGRYSNKPIVGAINPALKSPVLFSSIEKGFVETHGMRIELLDKEVVSISAVQQQNTISILFPQGLKNLFAIGENEKCQSKWIFKLDHKTITGGQILMHKKGNLIDIQMDVTKGWKPQNLPLSFCLFTLFVRSFRKWPTTYYWKGKLDLTQDGFLESKWLRK